MEGAARQRRVLGLLAIVAAGKHRGVSRDRVLALLWSESEPERARQTLTQAIYHTRRALGADDVFLASADLRLNPDVISSDVNEFEQLLDAAQLKRAVDLYQGPYLDGFYVNGAPEFERWVTIERERLRTRYAQALEELAAAATAASDRTGGVEWRKRLAALDPLNSRIALELMRAMAAAGDRAGAIKHAQVHQSLLREELNAAPNPAIVELAEQLRDTPLWNPERDWSSAAQDVSQPRDALAVHRGQLPNAVTGKRSQRRRAWIIGVAGVAVLFTSVLFFTRRTPQRLVTVPDNLTVVAPFRVSGADPALAYLREGLVDLLVAKFVDDNESAAVDPGAVMTAWRQAGYGDRDDVPHDGAIRIARQLGGTRLLIGSVVGTPGNLVVNATLLGVPDGLLRAQASAGGASDSLTAILDRLVARLLAKEAGEWERLASRTSTSLLALRGYLDGQAAYRRGAYRDAVRNFRAALERDRSFAMAGLALANAAERLGATDDRDRGLAAAWAARSELTMRDSVYLDALAGSRYPERVSPREQLGAWERAAAIIPDRADVWHELGERLFFDGRMLAVSDWQARAAAAFRRSSDLDPDFASPLQYLVQLAAAAGDTAGVRRASTAYLRVDSVGDLAPFVRWRSAIALGDSTALRSLRRRFGAIPAASLRSIILSSQLNGIAVGDAELALSGLMSRAVRGPERTDVLLASHAVALNLGKLDAAMAAIEALAQDHARSELSLRLRILDALYGGADSSSARSAAGRLHSLRAAALGDSVVPARLTSTPNEQENECALAQWRVWTERREQLIAEPRAATQAAASTSPVCAALLNAIVATRSGSSDAEQQIARFEALLMNAASADQVYDYSILALARLHRARGDERRALGAIRRRPHMRQWPHYLATHLFEEGQLTVANGDTAGAALTFQHYLALRRSAVGSARADVELAREHLAQLGRETAK